MVHICSYFCRERIADCISKVSYVKTIQFSLFRFKIINFFFAPPLRLCCPPLRRGRKFIPAPPLRGSEKCSGGGEKKSRALRACLKVTGIFFSPPSGKISPPPWGWATISHGGRKKLRAMRAQKLFILNFRPPPGENPVHAPDYEFTLLPFFPISMKDLLCLYERGKVHLWENNEIYLKVKKCN